MEKKEMELKPCPFCGEEPQVIRIKGKDGWRDRFTVRCPYDHGGCGAEGGMYHSEAEAVEAWNRRDIETLEELNMADVCRVTLSASMEPGSIFDILLQKMTKAGIRFFVTKEQHILKGETDG